MVGHQRDHDPLCHLRVLEEVPGEKTRAGPGSPEVGGANGGRLHRVHDVRGDQQDLRHLRSLPSR